MAIRWNAIWAVLLTLGLAMPVLAQEEGDVGGEEMPADDMGEGGGEEMSEEASGEVSLDDAGGGDKADKPISIGLLLGYGLDLDAPGDLNPFGLGFGVRGGYNLDKIYLGARFVFFLGDSEDAGGTEISTNVITIGIEGGYDLDVGGLIIRPELGLGLALYSSEVTTTVFGMETTIDGSGEDIFVAPGVALLGCISDSIFIGADVQFPIILSDPDTVIGLTMMANGGMRF